MKERLHEILRIALAYGVTDIHFDIQEEKDPQPVIEMRVHGEIRQLKRGKDDLKLFRYLMYRANLDISDALRPQTGSFHEEVDGKVLSLRFAVVSSYHIISGVLRILNNHPDLNIDDLCENPATTDWMKQITAHRDGLFVFSGPTGSGKTTTLYTILNASHGKKIFTLEDPVEVVNEKYVQIQINDKQHMSYADGIKQLMRHDPDIVMIGEIRDDEAARMAVRCALTGHLVLTSLHSSSCVSALHRLMDLGIAEYQLADVLKGISCQRLYDSEKTKGGRTGVYEIMDRKQLAYWFENHRTDSSFIPLQQAIRRETEGGIITMEQAQADLA